MVASSNLVTPTERERVESLELSTLFVLYHHYKNAPTETTEAHQRLFLRVSNHGNLLVFLLV